MDVSLTNLRANFHSVTLGRVTIWFSYETPIAFREAGKPTLVRENVWGPTTGKHLNAIDGGDKTAKERRVSGDVFRSALGMAAYND